MTQLTKHPALNLLILAMLTLAAVPTRAASTLDRIRATNTLRCATNSEVPEYSTTDDHGPRTDFDAGLCRAIATDLLGPSAQVTLMPYPDNDAALEALRSGAVDLIPTASLSADPAFAFSPALLLDGVGFLVPRAAQITRASQLSGRKICFLAETQVEVSLRDYFTRAHLHFLPFPFQEEGEMEAAFVTGNCTALAGDLTRLASTHIAFHKLASRYTLLPDQVSTDPLAVATFASDPVFTTRVQAALQTLLQTGTLAGIFNRTLGPQSPLQLPATLLAPDNNVEPKESKGR